MPDTRSLVNRNGYVELLLTVAEPRITIGLANHADFAQLNALAASTLSQVAKNVTFEAHADEASIRALLDYPNFVGRSALARFKLHVNIFGLKSDSEPVGTLLSDNGLYLQEPYHRTEDCIYYNPHVWTFDDLPDIDIWLAGLSRGKLIGEQMAAEQGWNRVLDDLSSFDSGHKDLDTSCLTVPLLKYVNLLWKILCQAYKSVRHQIDALGFMTDREIGELRHPMRYWSSGTAEDGTLVYVMQCVLT